MNMSRRDQESLPAIPENSATNIRPSRWDDEEDAEDREEQGLFERDNIDAADDETENIIGKGGRASGGPENGGPVYVQSSAGDSWELTWPIWHMLPRNERRAIAAQYGMKSIGEFEEYMSLTRAVDESGGDYGGERSVVSFRGDESRLGIGMEAAESSVSHDSSDENWHPPFIGMADIHDDDSSFEYDDDARDGPGEDTHDNVMENHLEIIRLGGLPCSIPDELLHRCFAYLPIDNHATLALVSPHWSRFTRSEALYKTLCQRIYLNQSKRKTLHVSRFGNSYRRMLEVRPRVRTGGGMYVLKYQEVRKIQRDMWTEIPHGAVLESVYYRYIYFFEDGRVIYALTHTTPVEMIPRFANMLLHGYGSKDKWGVWGRYQIMKDVVRVWASHSWHDVCFQLKVIQSNKIFHYDTGDWGVCTTMVLEKHMSSASGNFASDSYDLVNYDIPNQCHFRFLRDRRL